MRKERTKANERLIWQRGSARLGGKNSGGCLDFPGAVLSGASLCGGLFAQGVRTTQQLQNDNSEQARILYNTWNIAKNIHSVIVSLLAGERAPKSHKGAKNMPPPYLLRTTELCATTMHVAG